MCGSRRPGLFVRRFGGSPQTEGLLDRRVDGLAPALGPEDRADHDDGGKHGRERHALAEEHRRPDERQRRLELLHRRYRRKTLKLARFGLERLRAASVAVLVAR